MARKETPWRVPIRCLLSPAERGIGPRRHVCLDGDFQRTQFIEHQDARAEAEQQGQRQVDQQCE